MMTRSNKQIIDDLIDGIEQIYCQKHMSRTRYIELYSNVYNICMGNGEPGSFHNPLDIGISGGEQIYQRVEDFLKQHVLDIAKNGVGKIGDEHLTFYAKQWRNYKFASTVVDALLECLNRVFVLRKVDFNQYGQIPIYKLALIKWRDHFFSSSSTQEIDTILRLIKKERQGGNVNTKLIASVLRTLLEISWNYSNPTRNDFTLIQDNALYQTFFEAAFIDKTSRFYSLECATFLRHNSVCEYVKKVELRLKEEEKRCQSYLNDMTLVPLINTCEKVFISDHLDVLLAEFSKLIADGRKIDDLNRLYKRLKRLGDGERRISITFEMHISKCGALAIEKCGEEIANEPKLFFETVTQLHKKYKDLVFVAFDNSTQMAKAGDKGCAKFINDNFITRMENSSSAKIAELLAKFCDIRLKKSSKSSHYDNLDLEDALAQIIIVFRFIEDKDVFQKFYSRAFAKRLVQNTSISENAELSIISGLKECCGFQYTYKLQNMYKDIGLNKTLNEQFRSNLVTSNQSLDLDLNIQVLRSGSWPLLQSCFFVLPPELEKSVQSFTSFYNHLHNGRKLTWLHQLAKGELVTNCFKNRYTIQVSTLQMAVLLQYNTRDSFTVKELEEITQMKLDYLIQVLQVLIKSKLLTCDDDLNDLNQTSVVGLFLEYKNKKLRINVNVPLKIEIKTEQDATHRFIAAERNFMVQAAIVRIMKMRKTLQCQLLLTAVVEQLSSNFTPSVTAIKKNIDVLVEKEYLGLVAEEKNCYRYLA